MLSKICWPFFEKCLLEHLASISIFDAVQLSLPFLRELPTTDSFSFNLMPFVC